MTSTGSRLASRDSVVCSQASRAGRLFSSSAVGTIRLCGASREKISASRFWQTTDNAAPAASNASVRLSTYLPTPPRSAGMAVASSRTRGSVRKVPPLRSTAAVGWAGSISDDNPTADDATGIAAALACATGPRLSTHSLAARPAGTVIMRQ